MKRSLAILLAVCMIFVLCACGAQETAPVSESVAEESVSAEETSSVDLQILMEEDDSMINTYSLLAVNPDANFVDADGNAVSDVELNTAGADALINWMLSEEGEELGKTLRSLKQRSPKRPTRPKRSASPLPHPSTIPVCWDTSSPFLRKSTDMTSKCSPPEPARQSPMPKTETPT